jgi:capsular polysaccharide biosynthesis protein
MERHNEELEIDLLQLFYYLKKRILIIIAACLVFAVAGFVGTKMFITPTYTTNTRMYVLNRSNENMVVYSDYQISTQMLSDYKVLITGRNVTQEVVESLGLDMDGVELAKKISVTAPEGTRFVQISVTDTDPVRAAQIANAVRRIASVQIRELMDVDAVNLVYEAEVPGKPSAPNVTQYTLMAAVIGLIVVLVALTVVYVLDDTIRTEEDVARYLNLSVMGVIPMDAALESKNELDYGKKKFPCGKCAGSNRKSR